MSDDWCVVHGTACAFPGSHPDLCPFCHAPWWKILMPATYTVEVKVAASKRFPARVVEETRYTGGYGHTVTEHLRRGMANRIAPRGVASRAGDE